MLQRFICRTSTTTLFISNGSKRSILSWGKLEIEKIFWLPGPARPEGLFGISKSEEEDDQMKKTMNRGSALLALSLLLLMVVACGDSTATTAPAATTAASTTAAATSAAATTAATTTSAATTAASATTAATTSAATSVAATTRAATTGAATTAAGATFTSANPDEIGKKTPTNGNGKPYKVALIIAQGGLGDQSYNDLANAGLQAAAHDYTNLTVQPIQSSDIVNQGASILQQSANNKFDLVINLEFSLSDALNQIAPKFPNTQFAMVNLEVKQPNVTSVLFQEQEGSFLAGALAAMVTKDTSIKGINAEKIIGTVGGTKSTGIDKFLVGYQQGAQYIDKDTQVLVSYANSFGDPAKGKELTDAQYAKGADIVYQVAGGTGQGVIQSAKAAGKYAIGVDTDQDFLAQGNVLTSMVKRADLSVYDLCKDLAMGQLKGGTTRYYGLQNNGVTLSAMKYTKQLLPADDMTKIEGIRNDIISGKIKVWNVIDQGYPDWFAAK